MGSSKGFEYKIHLSVSADDFTPDIQKILKNVQTQADKNQVKLTLSGDPKDLLKQLIDIKKQIPTLDLTDGMYVGLAKGIEQDTEKGKKLIDNFTTYIINSVQEAVSSISNLTEAISNTEEAISRLKSRRGQLFNDKDITNAAQAFEKAQERLYNASNAYSTSKQKGKKQQAVLDMQTAYQDILNIQSQAGQQISERTKTILDGIALETVEVFKSLTGEEMKLNEMFAKMKPNSSYVEMIQTLDSEIFAAENHLTDLKKQLENAQNPQLKVKGQLTDDFLTDLQSQLDKLQGLEVKVKPVVDKDVKLEVEVDGNLKTNTQESDIKKQDQFEEQLVDNVENDNVQELKNFFEEYVELGVAASDDLEKNYKRLVTMVKNGTKSLADAKAKLSKDYGGYPNYVRHRQDINSIYEMESLDDVNKKLETTKQEQAEIAKSAENVLDTIRKWTGNANHLERNMFDLKSDSREANKPIYNAVDYRKSIQEALNQGLKEQAAVLYDHFKTHFPRSKYNLDSFMDDDFKNNYNKYLESGRDKLQSMFNNSTLTKYRYNEDIIHNLNIQHGALERKIEEENKELERQREILTTIEKYKNQPISVLDTLIGAENNKFDELIKKRDDFQEKITSTNIKSEENEILKQFGFEENTNKVSALKKLSGEIGDVERHLGILKEAREEILTTNNIISTPPNTSGMDKVEEELHEEAAAHRENEEAAKADAKAQEEFNSQNNIRQPHNEYIDNQIKFLQDYKNVSDEYNALEFKASEEGLTDKEESRVDRLRAQIKEYDEILKQYNDVRVKLKNGESYSIIENLDSSDWNVKKSAIKDIVFELKEETSAAQEAADAERKLNEDREQEYKYSSTNNPYKALKKGGLGLQYLNGDEWNPDEPQEYEDNVVRIIESNEKFAADADITCEKASTAVRRFFDTIGKQIPELAAWKDMILEAVDSGTYKEFDTDSGLWGWGLEATDEGRWYMYVNQTKEAAEETVTLRYELAQLGSLKNKIFKNWGFSGFNFKNGIFPEDQEKYLAEEERIITEVKAGTLNYYDAKDELSNMLVKMSHNKFGADRFIDETREFSGIDNFKSSLLEQIKNGSLEAGDAIQMVKDKIADVKEEATQAGGDSSAVVSQLEKEFEAREKNVQATDAQSEAELRRQSLIISHESKEALADALQRTQPEVDNLIESEKKVLEAPGETPNTSGLDKINKSLDNVQEKAEKTVKSIGRIYLSQTGDANSGNYAYTRLADSKNLAEYYKGVVATDKDGGVQSGEVRLVNYTKLLNELLKFDKEIFQIEQEINKVENDQSVVNALTARKTLIEGQRKPYEELLDLMRQKDEYLINGNEKEINYINQRRDAQLAELQAEQNIKQARIDSSNQSKAIQEEEAQRQERIAAIMKRREQYLRTELEYRKLIAGANPEKDKEQIFNWSQQEKQYKALYDGESRRLSNLDAEIAKEQELNALNKIKVDYEEQIVSIQAKKADKSRNTEAEQQNKLAEEAVKIYEKLQKVKVDAEKLSIGKASQEELQNANDLVEELTKKYKALIEQMKKLGISFSNEQQFKINQAGADAQQAIDKIHKKNAPKEETEKNDASSRNQIIKNYIDLQKEQIRIQEQINMLEQSGVSSNNKRIVDRINQVRTLTKEINDAKKAYEQLIPTEAEEARVRQSVDSAKRKYTNQTLDDLDREEKKIQSLDKKYISLKQQIESWLISNPKADKVFGNQLKEYIQQLNTESEKTPEKLAQIEQGFRNIKNEAAKTGATGKSFFDLLSKRWKSLAAYLGSFTSFYRIIGGIKQAFSTIRELDTQLVDLRKTTKMNLTELNQFYLSANDIAQAMGVTTKEIISQAAAWSRLNKIGPLCSNI